MKLPALVAHADWSTTAKKRRLARAKLGRDGRYIADAAGPAPELGGLFQTLRDQIPGGGAVLAGFDFPIGLPRHFAVACGITHFREILPELGHGRWAQFFHPASKRSDIGLGRPFYPAGPIRKKGQVSRADLLQALGVGALDELRRHCDLKTEERRPAECIFWTLGAKQVGKATIAGWRDMLQPALRDPALRLALWPFAGSLDDLLRVHQVVVAETYPAEMYHHLSLGLVKKRNPAARRALATALRGWAAAADVVLEPALASQINSRFGPDPDSEDDFDAVVGLFGMLNVVLGRRAPGEPSDEIVQRLEGWMLGMECNRSC